MQFKNPQNGYVETATTGISWLWAFLWAPIYYAVKGIWTHAIVSFLLAWVLGGVTFGLAALIIGIVYACMNKSIVRSHYLKRGWIELDETSAATAPGSA